MTPKELANEVAAFIEASTSRITGIGAEQYHQPGKPQKFETMQFEDLATYYREELMDIANYAAMTSIRIDRVMHEFTDRMRKFEVTGDPQFAVVGDDVSGQAARYLIPSWQERVGEWAEGVFPEATAASILSHLLEEVLELSGVDKAHIPPIAAMVKLAAQCSTGVANHADEAADVFLLLLHYCHRFGINLEAEADKKFDTNQHRRDWQAPNEMGHRNHIDRGAYFKAVIPPADEAQERSNSVDATTDTPIRCTICLRELVADLAQDVKWVRVQGLTGTSWPVCYDCDPNPDGDVVVQISDADGATAEEERARARRAVDKSRQPVYTLGVGGWHRREWRGGR